MKIGSKCIKIFKDYKTQKEAIGLCKKNNAELYSIKDEEELDMVLECISRTGSFWVSAKKRCGCGSKYLKLKI